MILAEATKFPWMIILYTCLAGLAYAMIMSLAG